MMSRGRVSAGMMRPRSVARARRCTAVPAGVAMGTRPVTAPVPWRRAHVGGSVGRWMRANIVAQTVG
eukprot:4729188-Pleurochrysis_carterae.AAC.3